MTDCGTQGQFRDIKVLFKDTQGTAVDIDFIYMMRVCQTTSLVSIP